MKEGNTLYASIDIVRRMTPNWGTFEANFPINSNVSLSTFSHYM